MSDLVKEITLTKVPGLRKMPVNNSPILTFVKNENVIEHYLMDATKMKGTPFILHTRAMLNNSIQREAFGLQKEEAKYKYLWIE